MPNAMYKNAWNCKKCPESSGKNGCPAWTEYAEKHGDGTERITKECLFQALPKFLLHTLAASNRPAAAMESLRNELLEKLNEPFVVQVSDSSAATRQLSERANFQGTSEILVWSPDAGEERNNGNQHQLEFDFSESGK